MGWVQLPYGARVSFLRFPCVQQMRLCCKEPLLQIHMAYPFPQLKASILCCEYGNSSHTSSQNIILACLQKHLLVASSPQLLSSASILEPKRLSFFCRHEIVGIVTAVGSKVHKFKVGDRAGVGCLVDSCAECHACQVQREEQFCAKAVQTYNMDNYDGTPTYGGYSTHITVADRYGGTCVSPSAQACSADAHI